MSVFAASGLTFSALRTLPMTMVTSITFAAPLAVALLAGPILGETIGPRRVIVVITGFVGVLVITRPGTWLGWPQTMGAKSANTAAPEVVWEPWSTETVAKLRAEGRIVYVDFTARWCATCQANKKLVFHSDDVLKYFAEKKIVTLRGDWTNKDPKITAELAAYNRSAVPFNLIWMPGKADPIILPELLTPDTVLTALKKG